MVVSATITTPPKKQINSIKLVVFNLLRNMVQNKINKEYKSFEVERVNKPVGDIFQKETKYYRNKHLNNYLDWSIKPKIYKKVSRNSDHQIIKQIS